MLKHAGTERDMSTLKLQIEALVSVLQAPSPEDQARTMRQQILARRERARKMALEVLSKGPAKAEKIGEAIGLNAGEASQILRGLIKNGLVRNKGGRPATYAIIERV
jgi:predicted transcriptional regulator